MVYNGSEQHKINAEKARQAALRLLSCRFCGVERTLGNIVKHENSCRSNPEFLSTIKKICIFCEKDFYPKDKRSVTCSKACSNKQFRTKYPDDHPRRKGRLKHQEKSKYHRVLSYRRICLEHHKPECVVCGEKLALDIHHLNKDAMDNRLENLIPLCPTHHRYMHSKHKHLIEEKINLYIADFLAHK